jgi:hypothetical protein
MHCRSLAIIRPQLSMSLSELNRSLAPIPLAGSVQITGIQELLAQGEISGEAARAARMPVGCTGTVRRPIDGDQAFQPGLLGGGRLNAEQLRSRTDKQCAVCDGRSGHDALTHIIDGQLFILRAVLQYGDLAVVSRQVDLTVT